MRLLLPAAALLLMASARPVDEREVRTGGITLRYDMSLFAGHSVRQEPKLTAKGNGDGVPEGVAPERTRIEFQPLFPADDRGYVLITPLHDASVPRFSTAYPDVDAAARALRLAIAARSLPTRKQLETANLCVDSEIALYSRLELIRTPGLAGFAFLAQYTQEEQPEPANNRELRYVFVGLTAGGTHLLEASFPVQHPALPNDPAAAESTPRDRARNYLRLDEKRLAGFPEERFQPSLAALKALIRSIAVKP